MKRKALVKPGTGSTAQRGVSLIELMVGLLIGLLAVLVISQVLLAVEGQKRSTTSGADAQLTGTLAMYTLQRDLEMAGYGLTTSQVGLGCIIRSVNFTATNGGTTRTLAPVVITDGGVASGGGSNPASLPDTVRIFASSKSSFSVPVRVTSDHPLAGATSGEFGVNNVIGVVNTAAPVNGDLMVAVPNPPTTSNRCTVFRVNGAGTVAEQTIPHASNTSDVNRWNGATLADLLALFPAGGYPAGSYLVNLGAGLIDRSYSIANGALRLAEFDSANPGTQVLPIELFPQVVNMQAFYGKDTDGNGTINEYNTTTPTTPAGWAQVVAVRVAIVVRSMQYEAEEVTTAMPQWDLGATPSVVGAVTCGSSRCLNMSVTGDINDTDWKHYRYKVYDTVIPLRNLLWRS